MFETKFPDHLTPPMTSAEEKESRQKRFEPKQTRLEPQSVLSVIFASMFAPGLGQAMQKRIGAALAFFALFGVSIFFFYLLGLWAFVFYVPLMLYASLDVALQTNPNVQKKELNILHYTFGPLLLFLLLVLLLSPAVIAARETARRMQCTCYFKQLTLALHNYHDMCGSFPPAYTVDTDGKPLHSWRVLILPYCEQKELYDKIHLDEPWDSEHNRQFHNVPLSLFKCPTGPIANPLFRKFPYLRKTGDCYISVVVGEQTSFPGSKTVSFDDIQDGTRNSILLVERLTPVCWMDPNHEILYETALLGVNKDPNGMGSFHSARVRCSIALCDGSIVFLPDDTPSEILKALLTRSGGEEIDDWRDQLKR